jgi:hypothetical protein
MSASSIKLSIDGQLSRNLLVDRVLMRDSGNDRRDQGIWGRFRK